MPPHSPPTADAPPSKRARQSSPDKDSPHSGVSPITESHEGPGAKVGQSSSFRNVSACNRCRLRKNRCDLKLPSCASCEKAKVACIGYDPITKREIPRSYVFYLETRVEQLEALLRANNISFPPADDLEYCSRPSAETGLGQGQGHGHVHGKSPTDVVPDMADRASAPNVQSNGDEQSRPNKSMRIASSGKRYLGSTNGVSFARVVFAAVQSSVSDQRSNSDKAGVRPYKPVAGNGAVASGTSMRDSFFGLHTRPTIDPAEFPDKELAYKLVSLYFEHANPQIPVLHRGDFMHMFEKAYATEGRVRGPRELYMLNMVFAIGGGIIMDGQANSKTADGEKKKQAQPEQYHASAIVHLEACLGASGGGLEELQAVLLLANFALLRPVPPGLWYIVGVAVRLAVDLGLHYEDGKDVDFGLSESEPSSIGETMNSREARKGRREYIRDLRRRLWWCTYSFDRLVSTCVGRPFGVSDQVITTEFPSLADDKYITHGGIRQALSNPEPTYKIVAYHYFRLRLLQSEILQVLQYQQTQIARAGGQNVGNVYMHTRLPSPFLYQFESFRAWRADIDKRLFEWKNSAPSKKESGVQFSPEFLELNYWQAIIMLYRQSLSVPAMFEGEYHTSKEVNSPSLYPPEAREDEERVYVKVAEAGQKIIRLYRSLHLVGLVNYTYLATHHLFMAGVSYLYAIWHSPIVRSRLTMDEVDFTILAATSVFTDLIDKCPPAEACHDAFHRTAKATVKMANSTGGFGQVPNRAKRGSKGAYDGDYISSREATTNRHRHQHQQRMSLESSVARSTTSQSQYDTATTDGFSPTLRGPSVQASQFSLAMPNIKTEPDSYSVMQGMPGSSNAMTPDNSAIDPVLLPSPVAAQGQSPLSAASMTPGSGNAPPISQAGPTAGINYLRSPTNSFTPGNMNYSDLQGMDFLQGLSGPSGMEGEMADTQMDLGFGLGWEGMHHDFSDGQQQVDLFDGFFFGGQQGGGGM